MRCVYCFEGDKGKHDIQTETTDDILRFLATKTDECRRIRVTWFGGEPLIAYNRMAELSRRLIGFCTANAIEYSADMTTNAYSLDDRKCRELCKELRVGRFIVTLDGTKTVHDKRRPHVSGVSSFERIWHNICTLVSEGAFVTIRMTIDKDNADNIPQLLDHIASSELYGKVGISFCRTVAINFTPQSVLDSLYSESEFAEVEWKLIEYAHRLGMWRYQFPYAAPLGGCLRDGDIVIGTDGEVYKCTDTIGDNRWITGHIAPDKNDMTPTPAWYAEWKNWTPLDNPKCMDCVLMPLCNGGCPHNALFADKKHGSESACPDWKANYRRQIKSLVDEEYT